MHRQSLGSPSSKLHSHGIVVVGAGTGVIKEDISNLKFTSEDLHNHRMEKSPSSSSSPAAVADDEEYKPQKPHHQKSIMFSSSSRLIHLIPILTFFCFLILYLTSHDPSGQELAQVSGFTTLSSKKSVIDSTDIGYVGERFLDMKQGDVLAIRSLRNLQQQEEVNKRRRLNRKFGQ